MTEQSISQRARKMVAEGALLLDVRTPAEYQQGHLEGALNLPVQELPRRLAELGPPDRAVVVYCAAGVRSEAARGMLLRVGFKDVLNLGSMAQW